ncbi:MAG: hypothetical protein BJ554DRAFT_2651, partial [Olpidium bornovanus]
LRDGGTRSLAQKASSKLSLLSTAAAAVVEGVQMLMSGTSGSKVAAEEQLSDGVPSLFAKKSISTRSIAAAVAAARRPSSASAAASLSATRAAGAVAAAAYVPIGDAGGSGASAAEKRRSLEAAIMTMREDECDSDSSYDYYSDLGEDEEEEEEAESPLTSQPVPAVASHEVSHPEQQQQQQQPAPAGRTPSVLESPLPPLADGVEKSALLHNDQSSVRTSPEIRPALQPQPPSTPRVAHRSASIADRQAALAVREFQPVDQVAAQERRRAMRKEAGRRIGPLVEGSSAQERQAECLKAEAAAAAAEAAAAMEQALKAKAKKAIPKPKPPKALLDPKVRSQLAKLRVHKTMLTGPLSERQPFFLVILTIFHVGMMAYEVYYNGGFESFPSKNPFGGPGDGTLTKLGAKFVDCMRFSPAKAGSLVACPPGTGLDHEWAVLAAGADGAPACAMRYYDFMNVYCGMGGFARRGAPDQFWRFLTPIGLHVGIVHLLLNLNTQVRMGIPMERQIGSLRMVVLYVLSG